MAADKPCTHRKESISANDLPLCCPSLGERVWDGHPRVYLALDDNGFVQCPYCETQYQLTDD